MVLGEVLRSTIVWQQTLPACTVDVSNSQSGPTKAVGFSWFVQQFLWPWKYPTCYITLFPLTWHFYQIVSVNNSFSHFNLWKITQCVYLTKKVWYIFIKILRAVALGLEGWFWAVGVQVANYKEYRPGLELQLYSLPAGGPWARYRPFQMLICLAKTLAHWRCLILCPTFVRH